MPGRAAIEPYANCPYLRRMEEKQPVNELLYDDLKLLAASGQPFTLQFTADNGGAVTTETTVTDVFTDETGQYLVAGNGLVLPLQQITAVNGRPVAPLV